MILADIARAAVDRRRSDRPSSCNCLSINAAVRRHVPGRDALGRLRHRLDDALRRGREARAVRPGERAAERQPLDVASAGRPIGGVLIQLLSAPIALVARRALVPRRRPSSSAASGRPSRRSSTIRARSGSSSRPASSFVLRDPILRPIILGGRDGQPLQLLLPGASSSCSSTTFLTSSRASSGCARRRRGRRRHRRASSRPRVGRRLGVGRRLPRSALVALPGARRSWCRSRSGPCRTRSILALLFLAEFTPGFGRDDPRHQRGSLLIARTPDRIRGRVGRRVPVHQHGRPPDRRDRSAALSARPSASTRRCSS